jgi:hypothetical protein
LQPVDGDTKSQRKKNTKINEKTINEKNQALFL